MEFPSWFEKRVYSLKSRSELQKKILKGGFWAFLIKGLSMPLNLVVVGLIARLLSPEEMGTYYLAFSIVTAVSSLGMLGMGDTMVRLVASSLAIGDRPTARRAIIKSFSWAAFGASIAAVFTASFGSYFGIPAGVVMIVAIWGLAQTGQNMVAEGLRSFNDIRSATIFKNRSFSNLLIVAILLFFWISGVTTDLWEVVNVIAIVVISGVLVGAILLWSKVRKEVPITKNGKKLPSLRIFSQAMPVFGVTTMNMIRAQVGIWVVAALLTNEEIALYGSANRLVYLVSIPLAAVVNALLPPIIAGLFAKREIAVLERTLRNLATLTSLVALIVTIFFIGGGNLILTIIYGEFYSAAWLVLGILALSQLIGVAGGSCGVTLMMTGHQKSLMKITAISAALAVLATFTGAKLSGMIGVAIAMVLVVLVQNILMVLKTKELVGIWTHVKLGWN